ncbi:MAG TPA: hypothetical protein DCP38_17570 [Acidobacteria bacterium]|jgi:hypothetical protein|nr:hypothetical protein [Acidobacteriota bacterium]MDP6373468.1 hypothetical protein [Vicinamibacterales bacterium]MQG57492.1 hypothetical protein [SAR202 cluster bacterium]HAK57265.1 hypothetical protein [Acidobacteriota bacterium]
MSRRFITNIGSIIGCLAFLTIGPSAVDTAGAQSVEDFIDQLEWRNIGPANMSGRIDDFAVVESDPAIVFAATASAGVWRTTNNGVTWEPVFDDQPVSSIGDIAVAPSDPSIVWVGSGEPNNRQSSSWGNGVYKSTDGGDTWTHVGLEDSLHIGRVVVHPSDPDIVYVAVVGHLWGPNDERGLYKTADGGKTWTRVLFIDEDTGIIDVAMDPASPGTLYAAAYQRRRTAFGFNGGGPGSGIHKTTDGGETWVKLTNGLPDGITGRIGLDIYRSDPRIVYAIVQNADGGVFRSEDRGTSWTRMSDTNPRPMYYSQIRIDPSNDQRIWSAGARMFYSQDGGKTFVDDWIQTIHGDYHALWINPVDSDHMIAGSDGGVHYSYDRGRTWDFVDTMALGQFYEIGYDMETPYNVYGGLQDNGSWGGPVRTLYQRGITNEDWFRVGGGDGFYTQVDPNNPTTIYVESQNGNVSRLDLETTERKPIRPEPEDESERYRFDWNSPILISPHDSQTIYYGGNRLFKSIDRGDTWTRTDDLTKNQDRDEMPIMGVDVTDDTPSRHDGISTFGQILSISESPRREGVLYVGTDDGNVQVSQDGGANWQEVAGLIPDLPEGTYVSRVQASHHADGRVYATMDGHRSDDYSVYVYVSDDYGDSWRSLAPNLPDGHTMNVIREHPRNENLLVLGGEFGAYITINRGDEWHQIKGPVPTVPVDDLAIHPRENDLLLGTHGRSIWVLDDMTPLEELSDAVLRADLHLFDVRDAVGYRIFSHKGNTGHKMFIAPNPPEGALIHYYLRDEVDGEDAVEIAIQDGAGETIRTLDGSGSVGLNRVNWDLRHEPPLPRTGAGGFGGPPPGPRALPGSYTVRVSAGGRQATKTVSVSDDPRIDVPAADRREQRDAMLGLGGLIARLDAAHQTAESLQAQLGSLAESLEDVEVPEAVSSLVQSVGDQVDELEDKLARGGGFGGARPRPLYARMTRVYGNLNSYTETPSAFQLERIDSYAQELGGLEAELDQLMADEIANLNTTMEQNGIQAIASQ